LIPFLLVFFAFDEKKDTKDFGLLRLFQDLKQLHIDAFADLHNVLRSKVVRTFFLTGKKVAVDKGRADKKALIREENKDFKQLPTMFERHVKVFKQFFFS
jgi:ADP-heptose:LPS heptosyltransferase